LVGVRQNDLPEDRAAFRAYFESMCRTELVGTEALRRVIRAVRHPARPPLPLPLPDPVWRAGSLPAQRAAWIGGVGLLGPELRARLGIDWSSRDERAYHALGRISRGMTPALPRRLRVMGPGQLRMRRRAIAAGPLGAQVDGTARQPTSAAA
jgi:uncharacterized protein (DUF2236 family)